MVEQIVRDYLKKAIRKHVGLAAGLLRMHFHDCFVQSGGPHYPVPLGRRDGFSSASNETTIASLPAPSSDASVLLFNFSKHHLDATDLVALSGAHTIGIGHCNVFDDRLYPSQNPTMDKTFAKSLRRTCPAKNTDNATVLDRRSPYTFDNKYYVNIMNRQGLFTSDQSLYADSRTRPIVTSFAVNQSLFFEKFAAAMIKVGQLDVLTGNQGGIRAQC
ncbi:putative Peroxidase 12 [Cocos nucifera]|uniref:peroxidase n=1 Tax=Cocos nucifera TaxID=13894 RepID=A0A8K0HXG8_COCNU|nr:putative Peroxidase 12 [Cocos nucifera]